MKTGKTNLSNYKNYFIAINFNNLFTELNTTIVGLAKEKFKDLASEAASDGTSLLHILQDDLKKYALALEKVK